MSLDNLPVEWFETTFENVIFSISNGVGGKQNKESVGIPVTRIETIAQAKIDFEKIGFIPEPDKKDVEKYQLNKGDILFSHINSPVHLGKTAIFQHDAVLYHGINLLRIVVDNRIINYKFFNYFCNLIRSEGIFSLNAQHAVNQSSINQKKLNSFKINLAPLAEQQEIVRQLDLMLAQVEQIKARLDAIPAILKKFRQSVLADAVSGKLTESWRKDDLKSWKKTEFSKICREITVGFVGKMSDQYKESGIPFLRSQNVRAFKYSDKNLLFISEEFHSKIYKSRLEPGDLAIVRSGAPGTTCVIPKHLTIANCSDLVIARPSSELNPYFGCIFMNSEAGQRHVSNQQVGVAQQHFNVGSMKKMEILLPPLYEQNEIVNRVENFFKVSNQIENQILSARNRVNLLTQSILAKAFSGELTAEWRQQHQELITGINSAESLLAAIQAEREASKPVKKVKKVK